MELNWFEALLYGFVSGLTEFMPVSAQAHQVLLLNIFGEGSAHSLLNLFTRIGSLAAIFLSSGPVMGRLYREYQQSRAPKRRRKRVLNMQAVLDIRLIKMACIPLVIGFIFYLKTMQWKYSLPITAALLVANGIILFIPSRIALGNKDSRNMSALDGILYGFGSALSVLPGISRIGAGASAAAIRGADPQQIYRWGMLLSVPALVLLIGFDMYGLITGSMAGVDTSFMIKCVAACAATYIGSRLSIQFMKNLLSHAGFAAFAYYSWGAALYAFVLYLY